MFFNGKFSCKFLITSRPKASCAFFDLSIQLNILPHNLKNTESNKQPFDYAD